MDRPGRPQGDNDIVEQDSNPSKELSLPRDPDDNPFPWLTNDFGLLRMRCDTKRPQQGRSESERYGHYPHVLASLPHTA
jgi:hypothetical protein